MTDSPRSINDLLNIFPDNDDEEISAQDLRDFVVSTYNNIDLPHLNTLSIDSFGNVTATSFSGSGASLTSLNASNLSSGTVADARLSSNVALKNINNNFSTGQTVTGTVGATLFSGSGASLTSLNGSNISSGTVADARLSSNIPLKNAANLFTNTLQVSSGGNSIQLVYNTGNILLSGFVQAQGGLISNNTLSVYNSTSLDNGAITTDGIGAFLSQSLYVVGSTNLDDGNISTDGAGNIYASQFIGDGSQLININASSISSGTIPDSQLSSNVPLKNTTNVFTKNNSITTSIGNVPALTLQGATTRTRTITNKALTSNVATLTTSVAHGFNTGELVTITSVDSTFNGNNIAITSTPTTTTFTYAKISSNVTSQSATGTAVVTQSNNILTIKNGAGSNVAYIDGVGNLSASNGAFQVTSGGIIASSAFISGNVNSSSGAFFATLDVGSTNFTVSSGGAVVGTSFSGSGASLTSLNASNLSSGTVADARLSSNVALKNINNNFSTGQTVTGTVGATLFSGSGASLTSLNGANISSGTIPNARLSTDVALKSVSNTFTADQIINGTISGTGSQGGTFYLLGNSSDYNTFDITLTDNGGYSGDSNIRLNPEEGFSVAAHPRNVLQINSDTIYISNAASFNYNNIDTNRGFSYDLTGFSITPNTNIAKGLIVQATPDQNYIITNKFINSNVATITTSVSHNLRVGESVFVNGVDGTFNGTYIITNIPSSTTFQYAKTHANVASSSSSGTITANQIGNLLEVRDGGSSIWWQIDSAGTLSSLNQNFSVNAYGEVNIGNTDGTTNGALQLLNDAGETTISLSGDGGEITASSGFFTVDQQGFTNTKFLIATANRNNQVPLKAIGSTNRGFIVNNKVLTFNVVTLTTASPHGFLTGEIVDIQSIDSTFNGLYTITGVPSPTTFTYSKTHANVSSSSAAGFASVAHNADLFEIQRYDGTNLFRVASDGTLYNQNDAIRIDNGAIYIGNETGSTNGSLYLYNDSGSNTIYLFADGGEIHATSIYTTSLVSFDNGSIISDGTGHLTINGNTSNAALTVNGYVTFDNGAVSTSGSGRLNASSFSGDGNSLTNLNLSGYNISQLNNDAYYTTYGSNVSQFSNDAEYVTSGSNISTFNNDAYYATSGSNVSSFNNDANYITLGSLYGYGLSNFNNDVGYVTSGSNVSQFNNDAEYVITGSNVSQFSNDSGYVTYGSYISTFNNDAGYITLSSLYGYNISNFNNDAYYATSGSNVSQFSNDAGYVTYGSNISTFNNDAYYLPAGSPVSNLTPPGDGLLYSSGSVIYNDSNVTTNGSGVVSISAGGHLTITNGGNSSNTTSDKIIQINFAGGGYDHLITSKHNTSLVNNTIQFYTSTGTTGSYVHNVDFDSSLGLTSYVRSKLTTSSSSNIPLVVQGATSQSANLTEWQDSGGTTLANINPSGTLKIAGGGGTGLTDPSLKINNSSSVNPTIVWNSVSGSQGLFFYSGSSNVARLQDNGQFFAASFATNGGLNLFDYGVERGGGDGFIRFDSAGSPAVRIGGQNGNAYTSTARVESAGTGFPTLVVQGYSSQTANIQEWQNNSGTVLSSVDKDGYAFPFPVVYALAQGVSATTGTNVTNELIVPRNGKITKVFARCKTSPTGASLIFDINKNGTSIWNSTQANRIAIASAGNSATQTSFDTTAISEGDVITIDIDQVGSTFAGQDITIVLLMTIRNQ